MKNEDNKNQDPNIDLQQDAKNIVLQELEKNGVINYMRANIKKSILDIIEKEKDPTKQKLEFDFMTPLHRLNKSKEILITCHLIKDFLKFYELDYTFPIFENESNVKENIKRETLFKECKLNFLETQIKNDLFDIKYYGYVEPNNESEESSSSSSEEEEDEKN